MKIQRAYSAAFCLITTILLGCLIAPLPGYSAFLYKSYIVRYDRGWDILCDPYIVQKNDWVFKLFRQKGEISHKDFPEFLRIFKRLNPHIHNIDLIRPGQHIIIPLKKLKQDTLPGQSSGIVTIPYVTISNIPETLKTFSEEYEIQKGDCVSILIARNFGRYGSISYNEGITLFRLVNPDITDLDRIYSGQVIHVPETTLRNQRWYQSFLDGSGKIKSKASLSSSINTYGKALSSFSPEDRKDNTKPPIIKVASALDAKLINKGIYYFPRQGERELQIDLSLFPVLELQDGTRILFSGDNKINEPDLKVIKSFWNKMNVVSIPPEANVEQIFDSVFESVEKDLVNNRLSFSDQGIKVEVHAKWILDKPSTEGNKPGKICITPIYNQNERTPDSITRYLEQHDIIIKEVLCSQKAVPQKSKRLQSNNTVKDVIVLGPSDNKSFVKDLITSLGYQYAQNVNFTFPYAGIQIKCVSDLIRLSDGNLILVDFGSLYGDVILSPEKIGLNVIQVKEEDNLYVITRKILSAIDIKYTNDPTFLTAKRSTNYNTILTISGFLLNREVKSKILLATAPIHYEVIRFLKQEGIKIIMIGHLSNLYG